MDRAVFPSLQDPHDVKLSQVMDGIEDILRKLWNQEGKLKIKLPTAEFEQPLSTARCKERFPAPLSLVRVAAGCEQR